MLFVIPAAVKCASVSRWACRCFGALVRFGRGNGVIHRGQKPIQGDDNGHVGRPCEVSPAPPCPELFCELLIYRRAIVSDIANSGIFVTLVFARPTKPLLKQYLHTCVCLLLHTTVNFKRRGKNVICFRPRKLHYYPPSNWGRKFEKASSSVCKNIFEFRS